MVKSSVICWSRETENLADVNFVICGCRGTVNLVVSSYGVVRSQVVVESVVAVALAVVHSVWWKNCLWAC